MTGRLVSWLLSILDPGELQNLSTDELESALVDVTIRRRWLWAVLEEMKAINFRVHQAVLNGTLSDDFAKESGRLQGIDWTLRQILIAKNNVALDKGHNLDMESSVAVQPIPN
jgi:hypothetical protein